jgi:deoxyribodipyrimidine photo-lyase
MGHSQTSPTILWLRRDLRLSDHEALTDAAARGPVVPVFILDPETEALGAAPKWRLGLSLAALARDLARAGSRLILRRGPALPVLTALAAETGAAAVHWTRLYDPAAVARDREAKAGLRAAGRAARSFPGHVLFEPWTVATGQGGPFRVFTPFWKAVRGRAPGTPLPVPARLAPPAAWPASDRLEDWRLGAAMGRGAAVVGARIAVGEAAALSRLDAFIAEGIGAYAAARDRPDLPATSRLSAHLTLGEISVRQVWSAAFAAFDRGAPGAESFLRELAWREFAWHLLWHTPEIATRNWRPEWDGFPWSEEPVPAWTHGMTGEPLVDAAMRELWVTGTMHNRLRMLVASYLTKHLLTHWRIGMDWFAECLVDWDPASNALGWQWCAGSGPDAAPYFRILNPALQAAKFDPDGRYRHRFLAGFGGLPPHADALAFFDAVPRRWGLSPVAPLPPPLVDLAEGRARALRAHEHHVASKRAPVG